MKNTCKCTLRAGFEKKVIKLTIKRICAVYNRSGDDVYPCVRVLNRLYWYRRKTIRSKFGYHFFSILIVSFPLASTGIKLIQGVSPPPTVLDYISILLTSLTSLFAFMLGHFRFLEKWKRYRKVLENAIHICASRMIVTDEHAFDQKAASSLLLELEELFSRESEGWTPDPSDHTRQQAPSTAGGG